LIDFWVQRGGSEELLLLDRDRAINKIPESLDSIALRLGSAAELAAAGTWITNWLRMLPVITATRGLVPKSLLRAATNLVRDPSRFRSLSTNLPWAIQASSEVRSSSCFARDGCWHRACIARRFHCTPPLSPPDEPPLRYAH